MFKGQICHGDGREKEESYSQISGTSEQTQRSRARRQIWLGDGKISISPGLFTELEGAKSLHFYPGDRLGDVLLRKLQEMARDDSLTMEWGQEYDCPLLSKRRVEAELERREQERKNNREKEKENAEQDDASSFPDVYAPTFKVES